LPAILTAVAPAGDIVVPRRTRLPVEDLVLISDQGPVLLSATFSNERTHEI
jgi:hypothetical protein